MSQKTIRIFARSVFLAALGVATTPAVQAQPADLVARNGVIWTVDQNNPTAQAIAAINGRLVYVGSNAGVAGHVGPDTEVIDLGALLVGGASTTIDVSFNPAAPGLVAGTIIIANDDDDEDPYIFNLAGNGISPTEVIFSDGFE